jgi:hypothetical protein
MRTTAYFIVDIDVVLHLEGCVLRVDDDRMMPPSKRSYMYYHDTVVG